MQLSLHKSARTTVSVRAEIAASDETAAVIGKPHPEWGETVAAIGVLKPQQRWVEEGLKAFLAPQLARYTIPREVQWCTHLPRAASVQSRPHRLQRIRLRLLVDWPRCD